MKKIDLMSVILLIIATVAGCANVGVVNKTEDKAVEASQIMVFAAASLTESFNEIAGEFEKKEEGKIKVNLNFAGSQTLATSVESGAKADIFASASSDNMEELKKKGYVKESKVFAQNMLVIVKNTTSKYQIKSIKDFAQDEIRVAVGDKSVPIGKYWEKAFDKGLKSGIVNEDERGKIESNIKTRELNVKDVVSKVLIGEVDAGVVYKTDITDAAHGKLDEVNDELFKEITASYPMAILSESESRDEVRKFYDFVLSEKGKEILKKHRFTVGE